MENNIELNWDRMAKAYEDFTEDEESYSYSIEWPCIQRMLPDLKGKNILELGCGTGRFAFLFEEKEPNTILGIDISEQMLNIAKGKAKIKKSKAIFVQGDICKLEHFAIEKQDFIFSSTTFHYISDIKKLFKNMYKILNDDGTCIISLMHPLYTAQYPIDKGGEFPSDEEWAIRYLDKSLRAYIQPWIEYNEEIPNFLSTSYHHTFSDYFNAIISAGFKIEQTEEPFPPEKWKDRWLSRYDAYIQTPSFMALKLLK